MADATDASDAAVLAYLRRRGYTDAEEALRRETRTKTLDTLRRELDVDGELPIPRAVLLDTDGDSAVSLRVFDESYLALRKWVDGSIDAYKTDLEALLFPTFVYLYLILVANHTTGDVARKFFDAHRSDHTDMHQQDLLVLASVEDAQHAKENELCQRFLSTRYLVKMSRMAYTLFVQFITEQNLFQLTRLTHQHLSLKVTADGEANPAGASGGIGLIGENAAQYGSTNQKQVLLGHLPAERNIFEEMQRRVQGKPEVETSAELLTSVKQLDPEVAVQADGDKTYRSPARDRIPLPASKFTDINARIATLVEIGNSLKTSSATLPSVCSYTFHNTYGNLNSIASSADTQLVAGGFQDSTIRLWNLNADRAGKKQITTNTQLIGHAGPVYGLSFSPDNKYLVSSSADRTARLWSLETSSNLVCYKGHNYPVWDVDFGPEGLYFATASHDRTARLWSCDQIYPLRIFVGHLSDVDTVRFHPNSNYVLTGSSDKTCRLWDVQKGECVRIMKDHAGPVYAVAISPDGRTMASAGEDASVILWDLGSAQPIKKMRGHKGVVNSLAFSKDGNTLISGGSDNSVRLWRVKDADTAEIARFATIDSGRSSTADPNELGAYPTKKTPLLHVTFSRRNLAMVFGPYIP